MPRDDREPRPPTWSTITTGIGQHIGDPPPKNRFATVRRNCSRCGLPADTNAPTCPVCGARYAPTTRRGRLLARLRR
jgi:hypothetical protein